MQSRNNRQVWPWITKWSRAKANRVLSREHAGHSRHPLPTTQEMTLHMDITRWNEIMFFAAKDGESSLQRPWVVFSFFAIRENFLEILKKKKKKHGFWYSYFSRQVVNLRIRMVLEWVWEKWADETGWPCGTDLWSTESLQEPPPPETEWNSTMARNFVFSGPGLFFVCFNWMAVD